MFSLEFDLSPRPSSRPGRLQSTEQDRRPVLLVSSRYTPLEEATSCRVADSGVRGPMHMPGCCLRASLHPHPSMHCLILQHQEDPNERQGRPVSLSEGGSGEGGSAAAASRRSPALPSCHHHSARVFMSVPADPPPVATCHVQLLSTLDHPNIIAYQECFVDAEQAL